MDGGFPVPDRADAFSSHPSFSPQPRRKVTMPRLPEQRSYLVPPLPRVFNDLRRSPPRFEDVPVEPRAQFFPQFESLVPLCLRASDAATTGAAGGSPASLGARPPSSATSDSAVDSAVGTSHAGSSSAAASASSRASTATGGNGSNLNLCPLAGGSTSRPFRVGVVFGAERMSLPAQPVNVIAGLITYLSARAPGSRVIGFKDGPMGLLSRDCQDFDVAEVLRNLNHGNCLLSYAGCSEGDFSVQSRMEEAQKAAEVCSAEQLDSLVVIGGTRDLSWAAAIATCFLQLDCPTSIIGVPHSKNLNLYVPHFMPITLGFDSARRSLGEVAGNIFLDALSSKKYWHFLRCGDDALTMEVALQTRCTFSMLTMEGRQENSAESNVLEDRMSLKQAVSHLQQVFERRRSLGRPSGVVLISRHVLKSLPEMEELKQELMEILGEADAVSKAKPPSFRDVEKQLARENTRELFKRLPRGVQMSLILQRDSAGMPLLPGDLEVERILGRFVQQEIKAAKTTAQIAPRFHTIELRSNTPLPSAFDCALGYLLGHTAGALVCEKKNFYVASCANMHLPVAEWEPCALPFSYLYPSPECPTLRIPPTGSRLRPNIMEAFRHFREAWVEYNIFKAPGPVQFDGAEVGPMSDRPFTLLAEYLSLDELKQMIQPVSTLPPPLRISSEPLVERDFRVAENLSPLERERLRYMPALPTYLRSPVRAQDMSITPQACDSSEALARCFPHTYTQGNASWLVPVSESHGGGDASNAMICGGAAISQLRRPLRVGVVFTGSQAPGYHTVVAGLFDYLARLSPPAEVIGFLGGFEGLTKDLATEISRDLVDQYRNLGSQDMLCHFGDPDSLAAKGDLKSAVKTIEKHRLDGLVLVGQLLYQVDSARLAEACAMERLATHVVGVPVSIDSEFPFVQQTVGYDTSCRTMSAYIGDIGNLAQTSGNLWIFIRVLGDACPHIAVEVALQTHPNLLLIPDHPKDGQSLAVIVNSLADLIVKRYSAGHNYGVVMIPSGFVTDITEMRFLFSEIMEIMENQHHETSWDSIPNIAAKLRANTAALFDIIPRDVQYEICFGGRERNTRSVELSIISTDRLLLRFVEIELERRRKLGLIEENFFNGKCYPMVYHARSAMPTNFDCDLAYTLGWGAAALVCHGKSGQLIHASGLEKEVDEWRVEGIPLTSLLSVEVDKETRKEFVVPAPLQLLKQRGIAMPMQRLPLPEERVAVYHGPVQFSGSAASDPALRTTWFMENMPLQDPTGPLHDIAMLCSELQSTMAMAKAASTMYAVNSLLGNAVSILESYKNLSDSSTRKTQSLADCSIEKAVTVSKRRGGAVQGAVQERH